MLFLAYFAARQAGCKDRCTIQFNLFEAGEAGPFIPRRKLLSLWLVSGPGDAGEQVLTIGFPEDF